jgi:hypothetical protein
MKKKRDVLSFETKCMKVKIDYSRCEAVRSQSANPGCGFACVKADRMYDRSILRIEGNRPVLAVPTEDVKKISNESLSWEFACNQTGNSAIEIIIPFPGLEEYRKTANLSERR